MLAAELSGILIAAGFEKTVDGIKGEGSLPPHCSGLAFDFAYKHMTAEEQNFLAGILARMEREGRIEAVRESGVNAAFHVFVL